MSLSQYIPTLVGRTNPDASAKGARARALPYWQRTASIYPLVTFRVLFGLVAAFGAVRFVHEGWIERLLIETPFKFSFYGFGWLPRPGLEAAYALYAVIFVTGVCIALGYRFRLAAPVFVVSFAYAELLDATNYLNHYYLVVLLGTLLACTPAHAALSLDVRAGRTRFRESVPAWCIHAIQLQLALVYFFAGLAKVNADWLLRAMPLGIWLPEHSAWPFIGTLLTKSWVAYAASWTSCLYDLTIVGFLLHARTRRYAYVVVLLFHGFTWALFNIGLFPLIMSTATLIFFSGTVHRRFWAAATRVVEARFNLVLAVGPNRSSALTTVAYPRLQRNGEGQSQAVNVNVVNSTRTAAASPLVRSRAVGAILLPFFLLQLLLPLRALAYPGPTAWTEEGYRFGWRVMLVEKSGTARLTVRDGATGREVEVRNRDYLTPYQVKQLAIQPDFVLQFAHHLAAYYAGRGFRSPEVYAAVHVALNGRRSRPLIRPDVDLAAVSDGLSPKSWLLPLN